MPEDHPALHPKIIGKAVGKRIVVDGTDCLNLASLNYLGVLEDENVKQSAKEAIKKYGVGEYLEKLCLYILFNQLYCSFIQEVVVLGDFTAL